MLILAVVCLCFLLLLKFEVLPIGVENYKTFEVSLSKENLMEKVEILEKPKPEIIEKEVVEEVEVDESFVKAPTEKIEAKTPANTPDEPVTQEIVIQPVAPKLPDSGVIMDSFYSGLSKQQEVPKEFQKSFEESEDFIYFEVQDPDWNKIVKLVDEELDKPRTQMNFYSRGIAGKFERMMDKITYTKTFTTKYGTKVTCGVVGVFAACSWK